MHDAIARTGYVPNRIAGGLASSRSHLIAAVVPSMVVSVFAETIETLNNTLFEAGFQLMLGQTGYSAIREELLLESIIGRRPDGIFLTGIMQSGRGRSRLLASGIPVVETWDLTPTPIDMLIGFSHTDIGREVAKAASVLRWCALRMNARIAALRRSGKRSRAMRTKTYLCTTWARHARSKAVVKH